MTELRTLLEGRGVRKAVVIDDAFDSVPRPDDLSVEGWPVFFDDLGEAGHRVLTALYPQYEETSPDDLRASQEFIAVLWGNREKLPKIASDPLFRDYEATKENDRKEVDALIAALQKLGLDCKPLGREGGQHAKEADLVFIDLFLGFRQSDDDMARAVRRVGELVEGRGERPPLVVLMSKSSRLMDKRDDFRDRAGLLGSTFRVVSKAELGKAGRLEILLTRLASHYEDAKRVAGFVHAWDSGLDAARRRFIQALRRLDLSDLAQIQSLLLEFEGQKPGEYLLDVADRVLQHEIEADAGTIAAALELNKIDLTRYPAPHLSGSSDFQDLVNRMVYQHAERLRLSEDGGNIQLLFGDVLRWKAKDAAAFGDEVSLVVTPACDLVRSGAERVMLLSGKLESLAPKHWSYRPTPVRTAIVFLPDEGRRWIRWNLKNVRTLSWDELDSLLGERAELKRIGRLREIYAIEIQQMLLADFGRVGRPANMPVSFPVSVSMFYTGTDSKARRLGVPEFESAACYVGRDAKTQAVHHLVLTEQACDAVEQALRSLADADVHESARPSLKTVRDDQGFFARFERGEIEIPHDTGGTKPVRGANNQVCLAIVRGGDLVEGSDLSGDMRKAALTIKVTDIVAEEGE